jgi:hypothetical protein
VNIIPGWGLCTSAGTCGVGVHHKNGAQHVRIGGMSRVSEHLGTCLGRVTWLITLGSWQWEWWVIVWCCGNRSHHCNGCYSPYTCWEWHGQTKLHFGADQTYKNQLSVISSHWPSIIFRWLLNITIAMSNNSGSKSGLWPKPMNLKLKTSCWMYSEWSLSYITEKGLGIRGECQTWVWR